ncbi:homogentisate 1,2-dioxygenase [Bacteriovoracaceae bacterium]|nr:homogentisate 1,2-dioxygenase [Bacteriovoracaceae bacterium]
MYYTRLGNIPPKRHITFYKEDKTLFREQLMGQQGFFGPQSLLYKHHIPSAGKGFEKIPTDATISQLASTVHDSFHSHFETTNLESSNEIAFQRLPLLKNQFLQISVSTNTFDQLFRNGSHHELHYIDSGEGLLKSEFGVLPFKEGDYLVIPRGVVYQWEIKGQHKILTIQATTPFTFPKSYQNDSGQFLEHSPICERDIHPPSYLEPIVEAGEFLVTTHQEGQYFSQHLDHHPFDTVGWDGHLYPFTINIYDFEPVVGRIHLPPYVHQMFHNQHFVVCNFVPRPYDFHELAIPAPYFHHNTESDEILYYSRGNFMSRRGISEGSISFHPASAPHGPQPGKTEDSIGKKETDELAVMIDTFETIYPTNYAKQISDTNYQQSWLKK